MNRCNIFNRPIWLALGSMISITSLSGGATLTGSAQKLTAGAVIEVTAAGVVDWVHWGLHTETSVNRKASVMPQISDFEAVLPISPNTNRGTYIFQFGDNVNGYSWSDGTPTPSVTNSPTGVWAYGFPTSLGTGFEFSVPADTTLRTLRVYVGAYAARGRFEASLSDGSAANYVDTSTTNIRRGPNSVYTIEFAANSAGQFLRIQYTAEILMDVAGNVTLSAAALTTAGANNPPSVVITSPPNNAKYAQGSIVTFAADARDTDGQIRRVEFYRGSTKFGEAFTSPYTVEVNNLPTGYHVVTAVAYDNSGNVATSAPVEVFVNGTGGSLVASLANPAAQVNLTSEGTLDWTHWGLVNSNSFDHKAGVTSRISDFTKMGTAAVERYTNNFTRYTWNDGTPTATAVDTPTGVFITGYANGFKLVVPADTYAKRLRVYVGLYGAQGNFQAYLSDMSAPAYTDQTLDNVWSDSYGVYTVDYAAATQGENLIVQYRSLGLYDADYGNVTLQSATLTGNLNPNEPPTVRITAPTNNAVFYAGTNILIQAEAMDSDGSVTKVEFLQSGTKIGEDASSPYGMVWSNVAAGSYTLTARATDNGSAINTSSLVQIDVVNPPLLEVKIQNARWQVGVFKFDVVTQSGRSYTVQYTAGLQPVDWQTFSTFQGDGSMKTITDSQPHVQRFYQLKVQ